MALEWISWWYERTYLNLNNNRININIDTFGDSRKLSHVGGQRHIIGEDGNPLCIWENPVNSLM